MRKTPTYFWNEKIAMGHLIQAAAIHRRMPEVRMPGYHTLWPVMMQEEAGRLLELIHGKTTLGPPMPPEVTYHEKVMEWLRLLERRQQQLVWSRANQVPWKILVEEFGRSKPTLWRELDRCLGKIVTYLNRTDPHGETFRRLRERACAA